MEDGKYKIKFPTGSQAFSDDLSLAVDMSNDYASQGTRVEVWEKDRSGWQLIHPPIFQEFQVRHRLPLPNGHWLEKSDENRWQIGGPIGGTPDCYLGMNISGNVKVGRAGTMDHSIKEFADAMNGDVARAGGEN